VRPDLVVEAGHVQPVWAVDAGQALLAAAALALRDQLVEHDPARLGVCADGGCADIYIDASPGAHRRFCSVTCQNRARVAKFRQRRKTAP
jgi:predicted RNA-binding Zn ribbon-like protein